MAPTQSQRMIGGRLKLPAIVLTLLAPFYVACWWLAPIDWALLRQLWYFPGIGVLGATIANTSGTGGGVVFVPVFHILRINGVLDVAPIQVTAASFFIQCFGMTMGAARWSQRVLDHGSAGVDEHGVSVRPRDYLTVILCVLAISLPVMLATQRLVHIDSRTVLLAFKTFSILFGSVLIISSWTVNRNLPERRTLAKFDIVVLMVLAIPGGFVTSFFSVGVGELVALYLYTRHYPILMATGTACVISSVSVLSGVIWHIDAGTMPWEVALLAAPGALLGGFLARPIALWLGSLRLKTLDGTWIVLSSLYLLYLNR